MANYQTYKRDDSELGPSTVVSVRRARETAVAFCLTFMVMALVMASLSPVFGYRADRVGPAALGLLEVPLLWLGGAAYFAFLLLGASWRLLAEPTELSIGTTGFRVGYYRRSRAHRWSDVVGISPGPSHRTTPLTLAGSSLLVELAGQPHNGKEVHRVSIPTDKPWPQQSVLREMLEEGRAWKVPEL